MLGVLAAMVSMLRGFPVGAEAADGGASYRGFPLYPPESRPPAGDSEAGLTLFIRHQRAAELGDTPSGRAALKAAEAEFLEAESFLKRQSAAAGWVLIHETFYLDGGSPDYLFAKLTGERLRLVGVTVWSGAGPGSMNWGDLTYTFRDFVAPEVVDGFPLIRAPPGTSAMVHPAGDGEVVTYRLDEYTRGLINAPTEDLPTVYGWTRHPSPLLRGYPRGYWSIYERGGQVVVFNHSPNAGLAEPVITWYSLEGGRKLLAQFPNQVDGGLSQ